jgi:hypothetical protein
MQGTPPGAVQMLCGWIELLDETFLELWVLYVDVGLALKPCVHSSYNKSCCSPTFYMMSHNTKARSIEYNPSLQTLKNRRQDLDLREIPNGARTSRSPVRSRPESILHALQSHKALVKAVPDLVD